MSTQTPNPSSSNGAVQNQLPGWEADQNSRQGARTTWLVRVVFALGLTLASSFFVTCFAQLPRSPQQPRLMRHDYCQWDCGWYADIAIHGYESMPRTGALTSWHFLP